MNFYERNKTCLWTDHTGHRGGTEHGGTKWVMYGINLANVPNVLSCTQALHDSATGIFPGDPLASNATRTQTMWFFSELVVFFKCSLYKLPFCHPITIGIDRKCTNLVFLHRNVPIFGGSECQGWRWGSHSYSKVDKVFFDENMRFLDDSNSLTIEISMKYPPGIYRNSIFLHSCTSMMPWGSARAICALETALNTL